MTSLLQNLKRASIFEQDKMRASSEISARSDVTQHKSYIARITNNNAKANQTIYFDDVLKNFAIEEFVKSLDTTARTLFSTITQTFSF